MPLKNLFSPGLFTQTCSIAPEPQIRRYTLGTVANSQEMDISAQRASRGLDGPRRPPTEAIEGFCGAPS